MIQYFVLEPAHSNTPGIRGSRPHLAACGHPCVLSPQGLVKLREARGLVTICRECFVTSDMADQPVELVEGALDAIRLQYGSELARELNAYIRRRNMHAEGREAP